MTTGVDWRMASQSSSSGQSTGQFSGRSVGGGQSKQFSIFFRSRCPDISRCPRTYPTTTSPEGYRKTFSTPLSSFTPPRTPSSSAVWGNQHRSSKETANNQSNNNVVINVSSEGSDEEGDNINGECSVRSRRIRSSYSGKKKNNSERFIARREPSFRGGTNNGTPMETAFEGGRSNGGFPSCRDNWQEAPSRAERRNENSSPPTNTRRDTRYDQHSASSNGGFPVGHASSGCPSFRTVGELKEVARKQVTVTAKRSIACGSCGEQATEVRQQSRTTQEEQYRTVGMNYETALLFARQDLALEASKEREREGREEIQELRRRLRRQQINSNNRFSQLYYHQQRCNKKLENERRLNAELVPLAHYDNDKNPTRRDECTRRPSANRDSHRQGLTCHGRQSADRENHQQRSTSHGRQSADRDNHQQRSTCHGKQSVDGLHLSSSRGLISEEERKTPINQGERSGSRPWSSSDSRETIQRGVVEEERLDQSTARERLGKVANGKGKQGKINKDGLKGLAPTRRIRPYCAMTAESSSEVLTDALIRSMKKKRSKINKSYNTVEKENHEEEVSRPKEGTPEGGNNNKPFQVASDEWVPPEELQSEEQISQGQGSDISTTTEVNISNNVPNLEVIEKQNNKTKDIIVSEKKSGDSSLVSREESKVWFEGVETWFQQWYRFMTNKGRSFRSLRKDGSYQELAEFESGRVKLKSLPNITSDPFELWLLHSLVIMRISISKQNIRFLETREGMWALHSIMTKYNEEMKSEIEKSTISIISSQQINTDGKKNCVNGGSGPVTSNEVATSKGNSIVDEERSNVHQSQVVVCTTGSSEAEFNGLSLLSSKEREC